MRTNRNALWAAAVVSAALVGCAEQLTYERWTTIHDGATPEAVEATLGKPWQSTGDRWIYNDSDRGITATVYFSDHKVVGKQWADPQRGLVGKNPKVNQPGDADEVRIQKIE